MLASALRRAFILFYFSLRLISLSVRFALFDDEDNGECDLWWLRGKCDQTTDTFSRLTTQNVVDEKKMKNFSFSPNDRNLMNTETKCCRNRWNVEIDDDDAMALVSGAIFNVALQNIIAKWHILCLYRL